MALQQITFPNSEKSSKILEWKVKPGSLISKGRVILHFVVDAGGGCSEIQKLKATKVGTVKTVLAHEGATVKPGDVLLEMESCSHPTVMRDLCAECGADLSNEKQTASVPMVHCVPELKVSLEQAQKLGKADEERLLVHRKLVLLVDLDQTLIHTTNDDIPPNLKDVHHFQLYGAGSPWYHTRLRPLTLKFLHSVSQLYELHICTFGARSYAHTIAKILDPDEKLFSHRILSRDECFDPSSKTANLKALFPCGDHMVCIIDDREDVWNFAPNLIAVKPYHFFQHTGDINAPPGLDKHEQDGSGYTQAACSNVAETSDIKSAPSDEEQGDTQEENCTETTLRNGENGACKEAKCTEATAVETEALQGVSCADTIARNVEKEAQQVTHCTEATAGEKKTSVATNLTEATAGEKETSVETNSIETTAGEKETTQARDLEKDASQGDNCTEAAANEVKSSSSKSDDAISRDEDSKVQISLSEAAASEEQTAAVEKTETETTTTHVPFTEETNTNNISKNNENKSECKGVIEDNSSSNMEINLKEKGVEEIEIADPDDYLLYLQDILERIHTAYYKTYDAQGEAPNMREVVPSVKRQVLANQSLVFSGVVPTHVPLASSRSAQTARSLGARVTEQVVPGETTHLVAARPGTAKVNEARRAGTGIHLVSPEWLACTAERWERAEERLFPLSRSPKRGIPEHGSRGGNNSLAESLNPLLALSSEDIKSMDQEVEDIFNETDDESAMDQDADAEEDAEEDDEESGKLSKLEVAELKKDEGSDDEEDNSMISGKRPHDLVEIGDLRDDEPSLKLFKQSDFTETPTSDAEEEEDEDLVDSGDESELSKMGLALEREFLAD